MPKSRPDNNELAAHIHKHQLEFDMDIEVLILKGNLHQKHKRDLWEDKFIYLLGTKASQDSIENWNTMDLRFMKPSLTLLHKIRNFYLISR